MSKLPCEVVKDLFPSYIDELTSEVTNNLIEEHTGECEQCRQALESMKSPEGEPEKQSQKKEIDYLKKTRKKYRKRIFVAILVVLAFVMGGLGVKHYFIGNTISHEYVNCIVQVEGKELNAICLTYDENMFISGIDFKEEDGVITISCKAVKRKHVDVDGARNAYVAENTIKEVRMGDRILWTKGEYISPLTSNVYQTRHAFVGDMPANNATANAIHLSGMLGEYKNELQTTEEPYGWHIQIERLPQELRFLDKCYLEPAAYILLAMVENLGEVTYEFEYDNEPMTLTYTTEMANAYAGKDIKAIGKDIVEFEMFIRKSGMAGMSGTPTYEVAEYVQLQILLNTEEAIQSISGIHYVEDGREWNVMNADYSAVSFTKGDSIPFTVPRELIESKLGKTQKEFYLKLEINGSDNVSYSTGDGLPLSLDAIEEYELELTGNAEEGYHVTLK